MKCSTTRGRVTGRSEKIEPVVAKESVAGVRVRERCGLHRVNRNDPAMDIVAARRSNTRRFLAHCPAIFSNAPCPWRDGLTLRSKGRPLSPCVDGAPGRAGKPPHRPCVYGSEIRLGKTVPSWCDSCEGALATAGKNKKGRLPRGSRPFFDRTEGLNPCPCPSCPCPWRPCPCPWSFCPCPCRRCHSRPE